MKRIAPLLVAALLLVSCIVVVTPPTETAVPATITATLDHGTPTEIRDQTPTATEETPTPVINTPTETASPTSTLVPPTDTPAPPTATTVPPTATVRPTSTATPTPTDDPTPTPIAPSNTPENVPPVYGYEACYLAQSANGVTYNLCQFTTPYTYVMGTGLNIRSGPEGTILRTQSASRVQVWAWAYVEATGNSWLALNPNRTEWIAFYNLKSCKDVNAGRCGYIDFVQESMPVPVSMGVNSEVSVSQFVIDECLPLVVTAAYDRAAQHAIACPNSTTVVRFFPDDFSFMISGASPELAAQYWYDTHEWRIRDLPPNVFLQGPNEYHPQGDPEEGYMNFARFEKRRCELVIEGGHRCGMFAFATGTPDFGTEGPLEYAVSYCEEQGENCAVLLHSYGGQCEIATWMGDNQKRIIDPDEYLAIGGFLVMRDRYHPIFRIVQLIISEFGLDQVGSPIRESYPEPFNGYTFWSWRDCSEYWNYTYEESNSPAKYCEQLQWGAQQYAMSGNVRSVHLFALDTSNPIWYGFSAPELRECLIEMEQARQAASQ